jgi:prevent-host-death family protein
MIISLREGKAKLSALVDMAAHGEEVVITVRGKARARLCPMAPEEGAGKRNRGRWVEQLREASARYSIGTHDSGKDILDDVRGDRT